MSEAVRKRMSADEFLAWAALQPETRHYELVAGEVVAMAPERAAHVEAKFAVTLRLREAIAEAGIPCRAYVDGLGVRIDGHTVYEPDALVRCGKRLPDDTTEIDDPIIVVEIVSPSSGARDAGAKLADYFRLASVRHYLIVQTQTATIIHHARRDDGDILTRVVSTFPLRLDPPGIDLPAIFPID